MVNDKQEAINPKIRIIRKLKTVNTVVLNIANNLSEIDIIQHITISEDFLKASSEITTGYHKIPITKPDHPTAVGVSLILEIEYKVIQFYEMNSPIKGYGSKMVEAVVKALPKGRTAVVVMDWSGGFWKNMKERYKKITIL